MENKIESTTSDTSEISLKDLILAVKRYTRYLINKWLVIFFCVLLGAAVGLWYSILRKPVYSAVTTFVLEEGDKGSGMGQYAGLASMVGIDLGGGSGSIFQGDNILELYKSRSMIEKTLLTGVLYNGKKTLLIDQYIEFNRLREKWKGKAELHGMNFNKYPTDIRNVRLRDSVLGTIVNAINLENLTVLKPDKKLSIIRAEVKAKSEFFAKTFDEQIVKNVNDFYIQTKTKKSIDNIRIMQKKTDSVRSVMNGAIYSAAAVADATPNLNITRQVQRIAPVQRSQFSAETNRSILAQLVQNLELSKISLLKETPLIQVVDYPILPLEKNRVGKIKGIAIGGAIALLLTCLYLIINKFFKEIII